MRTMSKNIVATSLTALLIGLTATTSDAAFVGHGRTGGAWHGGGWHGGRHGGGWGPGVGLGIAGGLATGAIVGSLAAPYAYGGCYQQYQPVYDAAGAYIGSQLVNVCY